VDVDVLRRWGIRVAEAIFTAVIGHGILLWLASRNIHPDQWVASIIQRATDMRITGAAWWIIAGVFGIICTTLIEYGKVSWYRWRNNGIFTSRSTMADQFPQATNRSSIGIRYAGGSMRNILIEGFETGIDEIHAPVDSMTILRNQFSGALFTKDARFVTLSNSQLKKEAKTLADQLRQLDSDYQKRCGPNRTSIDDARSWMNDEFSKSYRESSTQIVGEILSRIEPVAVDNMSPISNGGRVISTGKLDGTDPLTSASYFIDHIADKL
jgi:hypothetical protein